MKVRNFKDGNICLPVLLSKFAEVIYTCSAVSRQVSTVRVIAKFFLFLLPTRSHNMIL